MLKGVIGLFSFFGRAGRRTYWLAGVPVNLVLWGAIWVIMLQPGALVDLIALALFSTAVVANLAIGVRRLHDRGKRGWWIVLIYGGPIAVALATADLVDSLPEGIDMIPGLTMAGIFLWGLVELGFLPAAKGANRYGGAVEATQIAAAFD